MVSNNSRFSLLEICIESFLHTLYICKDKHGYYFNYPFKNTFRCEIPQCDTNNPSYNPEWLNQTIPYNKIANEPYKCLMYRYVSQTTNGTVISANSMCREGSFNVSSKKKCNKWVFDEMERTIVNDVSQRY